MTDALLGFVLENLNSLGRQEFGLICGFDKEKRKLSNTLSTIRDVLEDAEVKQLKDKAIKRWLKKLKDAAYDADDIFDECAMEALQPEATSTNQSCTKLVSSSFLSCFNFERILFRHKMGQRIREIRERLDEIATEKQKFSLNVETVDRGIVIEERETSSLLTEPKVYGREEDKENIVKQLLKNVNNPEELSIYPIIGMGGLGKTTLAQLAYNDERVVKHFDTRIWVCVSEPFDVKRLLREIIKSEGGKTDDLVDSALDIVQHRLRDTLSGKRFLLVLDDVWNEDHNKWDTLKISLTSGAKGSSIIVTTRSETVALIMGTLPPHRLSHLFEEDCWSEGLRNLTSLKSLTIHRCHALKSLAEQGFQGLSSLLNIHIENCDSLTSLSEGLGYLTSLETLTISNCGELESLPSEDLKHLISLRDLEIRWCPKLTSLGEEGIQHLTSLRMLRIWYCENLNSLPEGLQHLTALQTLWIMGCPHLERRCEWERIGTRLPTFSWFACRERKLWTL